MLQRKKIAIIGTGISGLGAAALLHPHHDITVYEKNDYIGGHSRTVDVTTPEGHIPVDTGFIVFNHKNYPLLTRLFGFLGVPVIKSNMSFAASVNQGWLEYGTQSVGSVFAQKRNLLRPSFWRMVVNVFQFHARALDYINKDPTITLKDCLDDLGMGPWFRDYFLLAMGGAIWSTPLSDMMHFPAQTFVRFFENHGLLSLNDQPQWYTVSGGSRVYVGLLTEPFRDRILLSRGVTRLWRDGDGVVLQDISGEQQRYDEAVLACHADQALAMMGDVQKQEQDILGAFAYQPNQAVLHSDVALMPRRRAAWASWVYLSEHKADQSPVVSLSYWMNNLQSLPTSTPLMVTLNPGRAPDQTLVHNSYTFEHPLFDTKAIHSQSRMDTLQGQNRLWFCGAYQRYGFHEDGLASAVAVAQKMGIQPPW
jgi:predicted NAD/FAD-binding protein